MNRTTRLRLSKGTLAIGTFALSIAVLAAHRSPARSYELSIYWATPPAFWLALFIAVFTSVVVSFTAERRVFRSLALWLGGIGLFVLTALPVIRGYFFFGTGDALTHLGTARDLAHGSLNLTTAIYPAIYMFAVVIRTVTDRPITWSLLLVVPVFVGLFVLFVPLCARVITARSKIAPSAVLTALLVVPIIVLYLPALQPIPTTEAVLFVPVTTFALLTYVRCHRRIAFGTLLIVGLAFLVVLHPQHALVFGTLLAVVLLTQFVGQTLFGRVTGFVDITTLFAQFVVVAVVGLAIVGVWLNTQSLFGRGVSQLARPLFNVDNAAQLRAFLGTHSFDQIVAALLDNPSRPVVPRSDTLTHLGVSVRTLYYRVFAVKVIVATFAFFSVFVPVLSWLTNQRGIRYSVVISLVCGLLPVSVLIALYVLAGIPNQYFRYIGFVLVFVTILAVVFVWEARAALEVRWSTPVVRSLVAVLFIVLLVFSAFAMFRSPYVYQPNEQVSKGQVAGYHLAFDDGAENVRYAGVDSVIYRYHDAIYGSDASNVPTVPFDNPRSSGRYSRVPPHFGEQTLQTQFDQPYYLTVTAADRQSSTKLYAGIDFSRADFNYLNTTPGIERVQSNGQFDLYLVQPVNQTGT